MFLRTTSGLYVASLLLACSIPFRVVAKHEHVRRLYTIPVHPEARKPVLEDVGTHGVVLINPHAWSLQGGEAVADAKLLLWDIYSRKFVSELPLPDWPRWFEKVPSRLRDSADVFEFQTDGARVVALQTPWLVLLDIGKKEEIRRVLPSQDYLSTTSSGRVYNEVGGPRVAYMAVNPQDGAVAAALNVWMDTRLYLYDSQLEKQTACWRLPRPVQGVCWSPDARKLAVLFNTRFEERSEEPDVWILDAHSGAALLKLWCGSSQSRVVFGRGGDSLYVINDDKYMYSAEKGSIRVFSTTSGKLVKTVAAGPRGVHNNFALSPDGRFLAADASTQVSQGLHLEPIYGAKIARVVLLDATTGVQLWEHQEKTDGEFWEPLPLLFSPDGNLLFVDFPLTEAEPYEHIEVFSLEGLP